MVVFGASENSVVFPKIEVRVANWKVTSISYKYTTMHQSSGKYSTYPRPSQCHACCLSLHVLSSHTVYRSSTHCLISGCKLVLCNLLCISPAEWYKFVKTPSSLDAACYFHNKWTKWRPVRVISHVPFNHSSQVLATYVYVCFVEDIHLYIAPAYEPFVLVPYETWIINKIV